MRFKMNPFALLSASLSSMLLAGCAHHGPKPAQVMNVPVSTNLKPTLAVICERPSGPPLNYVVSVDELRNQAQAYSKTLARAARRHRVLPSDYVPQTYTVDTGWDTLSLAYRPYLDDAGYTRIVGTVTCGHQQGLTTENRYSYASGSLAHPLNIAAVERMSLPMRWNGVGGYSTTVQLQRSTVTSSK